MKYKKLAAMAAGCSIALASFLVGENQSYAVEKIPSELTLNVSSRYDSGVKMRMAAQPKSLLTMLTITNIM